MCRFSYPPLDNLLPFPYPGVVSINSMPGHPGERQPGHNPQFHRYKPVEFQPYQGKRNFPTWSVYTVFTSYFETYDMLRGLASHDPGGRGNVRRAVLGTVEHWERGKPTPHAEEAQMLVQSFLMSGVRRVEWTPVYDTLRGEKQELGEVNELTALTYDLLKATDWQAVVKDAQYLYQADDLLRSWVEEQCHTWVDSPDARKYEGSVGKFSNKVLEIYFDAVDWQNVTDGLRE